MVMCAVQAALEGAFWNWRGAAAFCQKEGFSADLLAHAVSVATEEQMGQGAEAYGANDAPVPQDHAHCRAIIDTLEEYDVDPPYAVSSHQTLLKLGCHALNGFL